MGKQGPCCHCGVTSTPLWRNGPPEKPVLCNACGSRWRTKGTLANYTPLHARADPDHNEDQRVARVKSISVNKHKEVRLLKRKPNHDNGMVGGGFPDYQGFQKVFDEDISNRSSSGSAISNPESCAQFGSGDASDLTGPAQSVVWDSTVPSRKRTCVNRPKPSPVEKLTRDLYTIWHEQQSSCFSGCSEEDLLFDSETPMVSVEIGHGSVLIRHPSSIARDEESEASSVSVEKKHCSTTEAYSHAAILPAPAHGASKSIRLLSPMVEKAKNHNGQGMQLEQFQRDKSLNEKVPVLGNHNSPLINLDLNDVLNFEEFERRLTSEEQQQLLKYLPPLDSAKLPDSIKSMFDSPQFKENVSSYQKLHAEGIFDLSFPGANPEDCKTLRSLALSNLSKSKWVEHYYLLKMHDIPGKSPIGRGSTTVASNNLLCAKRSCNGSSKKLSEVKTMKSPKRVILKSACENKDLIDNDGSCFSPRSLFALPPDGGYLILDSLHFDEESSDQDLLLDVPSNNAFPQAELLQPSMSIGQQASISSSSIYPHLDRP